MGWINRGATIIASILTVMPWGRTAAAADDGETRPVPIARAAMMASSDKIIHLSWSNPADEDLAGVLIKRSVVNFPDTPFDGDTVYDGVGETHDDTNLESGTMYYYSAFAYDASGNYASGVGAGAKTSGSRVWWVDFLYNGTQIGTFAEPFKTLAGGLSAAEDNDIVRIKAGASAETATINQVVRIESSGGAVRIGSAAP